MVDLSPLRPGLKGSAELVVGEEHTAPFVGSGRVRVLATPVMINLIEAAALDAVEKLLPPGHQSLGTRLDVRHYAATPVGMCGGAAAAPAQDARARARRTRQGRRPPPRLPCRGARRERGDRGRPAPARRRERRAV